jgi:hypothetical protein
MAFLHKLPIFRLHPPLPSLLPSSFSRLSCPSSSSLSLPSHLLPTSSIPDVLVISERHALREHADGVFDGFHCLPKYVSLFSFLPSSELPTYFQIQHSRLTTEFSTAYVHDRWRCVNPFGVKRHSYRSSHLVWIVTPYARAPRFESLRLTWYSS